MIFLTKEQALKIIGKMKPIHVVPVDDDALTAVVSGSHTSRSSSTDSLEHLQQLTQKLVQEVTRTRTKSRGLATALAA